MDDQVSRLDQARQQARKIIDDAPPSDDFTIIGYALEADTIRAHATNKDEALRAIDSLSPMAVAVRPAALRAALIDARGANLIDLFADRPPPAGLISRRDSMGGWTFISSAVRSTTSRSSPSIRNSAHQRGALRGAQLFDEAAAVRSQDRGWTAKRSFIHR